MVDVSGQAPSCYGSEGWGFESLPSAPTPSRLSALSLPSRLRRGCRLAALLAASVIPATGRVAGWPGDHGRPAEFPVFWSAASATARATSLERKASDAAATAGETTTVS